MKITVIGTGYVGLVTGACLSDVGIEVTCVDIDQKKIDGLKNGILPIYEPGLKEIVERNYAKGRLNFSTDLSDGLAEPTPSSIEGDVIILHLNYDNFTLTRTSVVHWWG